MVAVEVAVVAEMVVEEAEGEMVTALWRLPLLLALALMVRRVLPLLYCWGLLFLILRVLWLHNA